MVLVVKKLPAECWRHRDLGWSLGRKDPLEKGRGSLQYFIAQPSSHEVGNWRQHFQTYILCSFMCPIGTIHEPSTAAKRNDLMSQRTERCGNIAAVHGKNPHRLTNGCSGTQKQLSSSSSSSGHNSGAWRENFTSPRQQSWGNPGCSTHTPPLTTQALPRTLSHCQSRYLLDKSISTHRGLPLSLFSVYKVNR